MKTSNSLSTLNLTRPFPMLRRRWYGISDVLSVMVIPVIPIVPVILDVGSGDKGYTCTLHDRYAAPPRYSRTIHIANDSLVMTHR